METPFYEQWWFLLVMVLSSLLVILLVVFSLLLHGQSKKYRNCGAGGDAPTSPGTWAETSGFSLRGLGCPHHAPFQSLRQAQQASLWRQETGALGTSVWPALPSRGPCVLYPLAPESLFPLLQLPKRRSGF